MDEGARNGLESSDRARLWVSNQPSGGAIIGGTSGYKQEILFNDDDFDSSPAGDRVDHFREDQWTQYQIKLPSGFGVSAVMHSGAALDIATDEALWFDHFKLEVREKKYSSQRVLSARIPACGLLRLTLLAVSAAGRRSGPGPALRRAAVRRWPGARLRHAGGHELRAAVRGL